MMASLFAGVSGLRNHQTKMNVIGNNIANVNTIGFKSGRVLFQEALVQTFRGASRPSGNTGGTNPVQLGLGMQVATVDNIFRQGGLETTGQITDLAIQGSGFFILADSGGNSFYSRAGAFGFDADSNLVDPSSGLFVQGKMADNSGSITSIATIGNIQLPFGQQDPARATTTIRVANNIDSSATLSEAKLITAGNSNVGTVSGTAVDGVGGTHVITITGTQSATSSFTGSSVGDDGAGGIVANLSPSMTLGGLGITDTSAFTISLDGGAPEPVSGLTSSSTIQDLMNQISIIDGIDAKLVGGQIKVTRDKAGDPVAFGFTSSAGAHNSAAGVPATTGNIVGVVFGLNGTGLASTGGAASTFVATDVFTPDPKFSPAPVTITTTLGLVTDSTSGLVTGLSDLGGGGITIKNANGLAATAGSPLEIFTKSTTHATSINAFDSQGGKHTVTIEFFKTNALNKWEWKVSTAGIENITGGEFGSVTFNSDGSLNSFDYFGGASSVVIDPNNGAQQMNFQIDAGTVGGFDGLTGFSGEHTASFLQQDGFGVGILDQISIDQAGNINGIFSNGVTRVLAQILLADFTNQGGLRKVGRSMYQPSPNSGAPISGIAGTTISGIITSGALESSSVDIAEEFTGMITAQRGFQANARIITTSDSMLDELVNLRR